MSTLPWGGHYTLDPVRAISHQLKRRETARDGGASLGYLGESELARPGR
jgi:hypothetical protein